MHNVLHIKLDGLYDMQVQIVKSKEERAAMLKEIGEETLPAEYGGRAKLVALQDAKLN